MKQDPYKINATVPEQVMMFLFMCFVLGIGAIGCGTFFN